MQLGIRNKGTGIRALIAPSTLFWLQTNSGINLLPASRRRSASSGNLTRSHPVLFIFFITLKPRVERPRARNLIPVLAQ